MESYPIIIGATRKKWRQQQTKWRHLMVNVALVWYTNLYAVDNGGHGPSLDYQCVSFYKGFKIKNSKTGKACIIFRNF